MTPISVGVIFVIAFFGFFILAGILFWFLWRRGYISCGSPRRAPKTSTNSAFGDLESEAGMTYSQISRPSRPLNLAYDQSVNADIGGVGRFGYVPREAELRRQKLDPTYEPKMGWWMKFIVGRKKADAFEGKSQADAKSERS